MNEVTVVTNAGNLTTPAIFSGDNLCVTQEIDSKDNYVVTHIESGRYVVKGSKFLCVNFVLLADSLFDGVEYHAVKDDENYFKTLKKDMKLFLESINQFEDSLT